MNLLALLALPYQCVSNKILWRPFARNTLYVERDRAARPVVVIDEADAQI
jgi:hypothetical protein